MQKSYIVSKFAVITLVGSVLAGCATGVPLQPGAEKVQIASGVIPAQCQYMGKVVAQSNNTYQQEASTISHDEVNAMKNAALQLNANVIALQPSTAISVQVDKTHAHAVVADAYNCPGNV